MRWLRKGCFWTYHDNDREDPCHIGNCLTWFISAGKPSGKFHWPYVWRYDGMPMLEIHLWLLRVTMGEGQDEWDIEANDQIQP